MATFLEKLKLSELSLVDKGANRHAKVTIYKRDNSASEIVKGLYSEGADLRAIDFRDVLSRNEKRKETWEAREEIWPMLDALSESINSIIVDANINDKMRDIETQVSDFLTAVREKMPEVEEELMKFFKDVTAEPLGTIETVAKEEAPNMANETKTVEELEKRLDEMTANLAKAEALAKMSDDEKAYMSKMSDDDKAAFMAMSAADRKKKMDGVKKNDETIIVEGETISKSEVGAAQFAVYKRLADVEKRNLELAEAAEMATFEKRAATELAHLAGEDIVKAKVLKAVASIEDEAARGLIEGVLKAREDANAEAFKTIGKSHGDVAKSVDEKIEKLADEIVKRDGISKPAAIAKAWTENPDLYSEYEGRE